MEILLSVSLIAAIAGFSMPIFQSFQEKNDLHIAAMISTQNLRRAQTLSQNSYGDSAWGVQAQSGSIVLFKGDNYLGRNPLYDEVFNIPNIITPSGKQETVFAKYSGIPYGTGTLTLTALHGDVMQIDIGSKGSISY